MRPAGFWAERDIVLMLGHAVVRVDAQSHCVVTADGTEIGYGTLVWATGGAPRRLACQGHDLTGVHGVRTRADVDRMIAELPAVRRVVVIGGGYIGLEAAAVLTKLGKHVTVLKHRTACSHEWPANPFHGSTRPNTARTASTCEPASQRPA